LGRELAHFIDDSERLLLEVRDRIDKLDDGTGPDGRAITGAHGGLLHLVAEQG